MGFFSRIKNKARAQIAPVMPMAPQPMQELRAGTFMPNSPKLDRIPSPPRMPAPPAVAPDISMLPRIPRTEEEARMFRMPEALPPRRGPMNRGLPGLMNQMQGEPRMMMAGGRDANMVNFLNSDPRQQMFGIETRIGILENQLQEALANNDRQSYDMIVQEINDADAQRIELMNLPGDLDRSKDEFTSVIDNIRRRQDSVDRLERRIKRPPMRKKLLDQMLENSNRFRAGKENARSPSRRDLELMEMQRQQQQARESLDDILSDLEKKN